MRLVEAELFHADRWRQTDRYDKAKSRSSQFCERVQNRDRPRVTQDCEKKKIRNAKIISAIFVTTLL
jgi:hypothetical protein